MKKAAAYTLMFLIVCIGTVVLVEKNTYPESWNADFGGTSREELYDLLGAPDVVAEGSIEWYRPSKTIIAGKEIIRVSLVVFFEDDGRASHSKIYVSFPWSCLAEWIFPGACTYQNLN